MSNDQDQGPLRPKQLDVQFGIDVGVLYLRVQMSMDPAVSTAAAVDGPPVLLDIKTGETFDAGPPPAQAEELTDGDQEFSLAESLAYTLDETVCGPDTRTQITNTISTPYWLLGQVQFDDQDGNSYIGSAWSTGAVSSTHFLLLTAGHCVYNNGYMRNMRFTMARNGSQAPYGTISIPSSDLWAPQEWRDGNSDYDYGLIRIPRSAVPPGRMGGMGLWARSDAQLRGAPARVAGYPGDMPLGTMWEGAGKIASVTRRAMKYMNDTAGGMSGGVVFQVINNQYWGVAIHVRGGCPNGATRITPELIANARAWAAGTLNQ